MSTRKSISILALALAFTGLLTLGGTSFAADANDAYHRAFPGEGGLSNLRMETDSTGKAAYGTPTDSSPWSGHDAYNRAIFGKAPSKPDSDSMGKAAFGTGSSTIDGHAAYRGAFRGD